MSRAAIASAKRVVIKVGSSSLTGSAGAELDPAAVQKIVDLAYSLKQRGAEVVVVSSGAIAAGLSPLGLRVRPRDLATQQAAASVGQGLLIAKYNHYFQKYGISIAQSLCERHHFSKRESFLQLKETYQELWRNDIIPIANENDVVRHRLVKEIIRAYDTSKSISQ